jgi:hypothetical protein
MAYRLASRTSDANRDLIDTAPPHGPRIYGHIDAAELTCPRCGVLHRFTKAKRTSWYDAKRGIFTCRGTGCTYRAYLGIVCWPVTPYTTERRMTRPPDHVLTPGEAAQMRVLGSFASPGRLGGRRERKTNIECLCGTPCPVHTAPVDADLQEDSDVTRRAAVTPPDVEE